MKSSNSVVDRERLILVGRIVGAHGVQGNLKVHAYAEDPSVFETNRGIVVAWPDGSLRVMAVDWARAHGRGLLMKLAGVTDRNQAQQLVGSSLFQDQAVLPALDADTYYWFELIGLRVVDTAGNRLGRLVRIIPTAGNDIYVIRCDHPSEPRELLIPAVGKVIRAVDLAQGTMTVDPPVGL